MPRGNAVFLPCNSFCFPCSYIFPKKYSNTNSEMNSSENVNVIEADLIAGKKSNFN